MWVPKFHATSSILSVITDLIGPRRACNGRSRNEGLGITPPTYLGVRPRIAALSRKCLGGHGPAQFAIPLANWGRSDL